MEQLLIAQKALADATEQISSGKRGEGLLLLTRMVRVMSQCIQAASASDLAQAVAKETDLAAVYELLRSPHVATTLKQVDPLANARLRGGLALQELLNYGGAPLKADAVASLLGVSRQTVNNWRHEGRLLGLERTGRGMFYPVWQFDTDRKQVLECFPEVLGALKKSDPWSSLVFFTSPNSRLNARLPIDVLKSVGGAASPPEEVLRAARCWLEHGAA